ncbi:MAG: sugar phosphate isomerase/epimerase, partial [Kangiellaceae bacterium]|nr:sugar phosphate isomerase/epimerase [Kangiellaceae bacterium]
PYKDNPAKLKSFLDSLGLKVSGVHVSFADLKPQNLHKNLLFYKVIGAKYVIVPWDERAWSPDGVYELVKELNKLVKPLANYGMQIGFHNHDKEFNEFQGGTYWDYIAKNTSPQVLLQLDVGWINFAGKDAIEYVKRYSGRTLTTHYKIRTRKDEKKSPIIGVNNYPWAELIKANIDFGGTQWIVVEQEEYPLGMTSLKAVAESKAGIEKIINDLN